MTQAAPQGWGASPLGLAPAVASATAPSSACGSFTSRAAPAARAARRAATSASSSTSASSVCAAWPSRERLATCPARPRLASRHSSRHRRGQGRRATAPRRRRRTSVAICLVVQRPPLRSDPLSGLAPRRPRRRRLERPPVLHWRRRRRRPRGRAPGRRSSSGASSRSSRPFGPRGWLRGSFGAAWPGRRPRVDRPERPARVRVPAVDEAITPHAPLLVLAVAAPRRPRAAIHRPARTPAVECAAETTEHVVRRRGEDVRPRLGLRRDRHASCGSLRAVSFLVPRALPAAPAAWRWSRSAGPALQAPLAALIARPVQLWAWLALLAAQLLAPSGRGAEGLAA